MAQITTARSIVAMHYIKKAQQKLDTTTNLSSNFINQKVFSKSLLPENAHDRGQWRWKQQSRTDRFLRWASLETRRNDNLYEYLLHHRHYYRNQKLHNTFLFFFKRRRMFPRRLSLLSFHQSLAKVTKRLRTPARLLMSPESGHRQPRYRVCAVTNPIWRWEL